MTDPAALSMSDDGVHETERGFRQRMWERIAEAHVADEDRRRELEIVSTRRDVGNRNAVAILDLLGEEHDLQAFRASMQQWAQDTDNGYTSFTGPGGQMFLNQLVKQAEARPSALPTLLPAVLRAPENETEAAEKLAELVAWVESVKKGPHPAPGHVPFLCSLFWSMQDPEHWPCLWRSGEQMLAGLGWLVPTQDQVKRYVDFRLEVLGLDASPIEVEYALYWYQRHIAKVGLDPTLVERCQHLNRLRRIISDTLAALRNYQAGYRDANASASTSAGEAEEPEIASFIDRRASIRSAAEVTVRCLLGSLNLYGQALKEQVEDALGRPVKVVTPRLAGSQQGDGLRSDGWVDWRLAGTDMPTCGLTLWATVEGVSLVLAGADIDRTYNPVVVEELLRRVPEGMSSFRGYNDRPERILTGVPDDWKSSIAIGRQYPGNGALGDPGFAEKVLAAASDLQPLFDVAVRAKGGRPSVKEEPPESDPLRDLVDEFRETQPYPTEKDQAHRADQQEFSVVLQPEELPIIDMAQFRAIVNGSRYGTPGPQSILNTTLREASPGRLDEILGKLGDLLWGDAPDEQRIDQLLSDNYAVKGLGESVIMKLLAITHPDRYIPVFPYVGDMGKARLMRLIDLEPPAATVSRGERQVQANDAIRKRLDPFFPNDPWGQAQFLYWLRTRGLVPGIEDLASEIDEAADDLHLDPEFLHTAVALLRDKGQIIFYGPPGTGKTYVARRLAQALAPDPNRRMVVQFHPSTSYEDFFEGYRPEDVDGQVTYRRTDGPLVLLAERASAAPGIDHVLIVDEINRANVPKVMGELLYMLEYREERVRTLYRSEEGFELPKNLFVIGTMNTADRSIALVDAALRRRFHFLPFFPHEWPVEGLLARWLEAHKEMLWLAGLVDMVNAELRDELGGPDLQVGPSYFMREGLDEAAAKRIWDYSVYPMIEDVLFGNSQRIAEYRFDAIYPRYLDRAGGPEAAGAIEDAGEL